MDERRQSASERCLYNAVPRSEAATARCQGSLKQEFRRTGPNLVTNPLNANVPRMAQITPSDASISQKHLPLNMHFGSNYCWHACGTVPGQYCWCNIAGPGTFDYLLLPQCAHREHRRTHHLHTGYSFKLKVRMLYHALSRCRLPTDIRAYAIERSGQGLTPPFHLRRRCA